MSFLEKALAKAGSKAELGRILNLPSSRVSEYWNPPGENQRKLSMEEGVKLCQVLDLPPMRKVSEEQLVPVLRVCLRYAPSAWTDQEIERLAQEIAIGLGIQEALQSNGPEPDPPQAENPTKRPGRDKRA